jgi:small subunit ribosomal protein S25e
LARAAIKDLEEKGLIKPVVNHSRMIVYTRATGGAGGE